MKNKLKKIMFIFLFVSFFISFININKVIAKDSDKTNIESKDEIINKQEKSLNISDFIKEANTYTKNIFADIDYKELLEQAISGNIDNNKIGNSLLKLLGKETLNATKVIVSIMVIIIIHGIIKSISDGLENKTISYITYYVQYILIATLIMSNFSEIIEMTKTSINNLVYFSNSLVPILMSLIATTGNVITVNIIQPILLFSIVFMGNFINGIIIPLSLVATSLAIISKVSDKVQLDRLSKLYKSGIVWVLGIILTLFVGILSIEGTLSSSVDGITAKTAKAAVTSFIPVVGKILGDAVDTVIGSTTILKNAIGLVGLIVILGICIMPIIKLAILMITYYIGSALCEPIADKKIVDLLGQIADTFKILLAIICSLSTMLIIGITLVVKISNSGLMYR